jgi:molybdate transport system permease protein
VPTAGTATTVPGWVVAVAVVGATFVVVPVLALGGRADWAGLPTLVTTPEALDALGLSLWTAVASTLACMVLGVPLALVLARTWFPGHPVLRAVVLLPLVLPPVVSGLALLATLGRRGPVGGVLEDLGMGVAFTTTAVVVAHTYVSLPFLVLSVEGALRVAGTRGELAAATLGASPSRTFWIVTLPAIGPAVAGGALLVFARSLGEFGATLTFAGSLQGVTRTLPIEIYLLRETDPDAAVALSMLLVVAALVVVAVVHSAGGTRGLRAALGRQRA